ncbi:hypothetical protein B0H19DRAFT_1270944 [Mycena capillaripes]|nr:hypothetical protein B0H19DRAFT_1270944 [Mycena capillaripes]
MQCVAPGLARASPTTPYPYCYAPILPYERSSLLRSSDARTPHDCRCTLAGPYAHEGRELRAAARWICSSCEGNIARSRKNASPSPIEETEAPPPHPKRARSPLPLARPKKGRRASTLAPPLGSPKERPQSRGRISALPRSHPLLRSLLPRRRSREEILSPLQKDGVGKERTRTSTKNAFASPALRKKKGKRSRRTHLLQHALKHNVSSAIIVFLPSYSARVDTTQPNRPGRLTQLTIRCDSANKKHIDDLFLVKGMANPDVDSLFVYGTVHFLHLLFIY